MATGSTQSMPYSRALNFAWGEHCSLSTLHAEKLGGTLVKDEETREKLHVYSLPGSKLCMFTIGLSTYMYVSMHERMHAYMMEGLLLLVKPNIYIHIYIYKAQQQ